MRCGLVGTGTARASLSGMSLMRNLAVVSLTFSASLANAVGCSGTVDASFPGAENPGGRALGVACAFDSQCATSRCSADVEAGTCGECVTIQALGQDCTGDHQGCSISAVCEGGVCKSLRKIEGEECALGPKGDDLGECDVEMFCAHVNGYQAPGECVRLSGMGGSCGDELSRCGSGMGCNEENVCVVPEPGSCLYGYYCGGESYCGDDGLCHPGTLAEGAQCGIVDGDFIDDGCGAGLVCGNLEFPNGGGGPGTPTTCVPLPLEGEPCVRERCAEGLFCFRPPEDSTHPVCEELRAEGDACSNEYYLGVACAAGLECRAKTCQIACQ